MLVWLVHPSFPLLPEPLPRWEMRLRNCRCRRGRPRHCFGHGRRLRARKTARVTLDPSRSNETDLAQASGPRCNTSAVPTCLAKECLSATLLNFCVVRAKHFAQIVGTALEDTLRAKLRNPVGIVPEN